MTNKKTRLRGGFLLRAGRYAGDATDATGGGVTV
jgi:hypothetical protein